MARCTYLQIAHCTYLQALSLINFNLGQNKMEQLSPSPPPPSNDESAKEQKRPILTSLKWGEGWPRCFIYYVQDCRLDFRRSLYSCPVYVTQPDKKKNETRKVGRGKGPRERQSKEAGKISERAMPLPPPPPPSRPLHFGM